MKEVGICRAIAERQTNNGVGLCYANYTRKENVKEWLLSFHRPSQTLLQQINNVLIVEMNFA